MDAVRVLAMYRGWEEPLALGPPGVYLHEDRPLLGSKIKGKSESELRALDLWVHESEPIADIWDGLAELLPECEQGKEQRFGETAERERGRETAVSKAGTGRASVPRSAPAVEWPGRQS